MSFKERYLNRHMLFEVTPAVVFFIANSAAGIMVATVALIAATVICTALSWYSSRRVPVFPVVGLILVLGLGGATLVLDDDAFVKMKSTVGSVLFACIVGGGMRLDPPLLKRALGTLVLLTDRGWKVLAWRWIGFSLVLAGANEAVWRTQTTDDWVLYKTVMSVGSLVGFIAITRITAPHYWQNSPR